MTERRFVLVDFTYMDREGCLQLFEAGRTYSLPRAVAHAAAKRGLIAAQRIHRWTAPGIFRPPEALTKAEVVEAEAELKALSRHGLEVIDPKGDS
jgi:hypothetical protein